MKFLIFFFCFLLQRAAALTLTLQSTTFAGQQSLLIWAREPVDGTDALDFNLRFVQGTDGEDAGSAAPEVHASSGQQSGSLQVVFPHAGSYGVIAVDDSGNTLGTSNNVHAITGPSASATPSSSMTPTASSKPSSTSASSSTQRRNKAPVIVGSVIASLVIAAILAALVMFLIRRRRRDNESKRWTFHRHMMVQPYQHPVASSSRSSIYSSSTLQEDPEQGLHTQPPPPFPVLSTQLPTPDAEPRIPDPVIYPTRVAGLLERRPTLRRLDLDPSYLPRSPMGPRPPITHPASLTPSSALLRSARPMSPILRSPSPRTHRQRAIADQIEILRIQMLEADRGGVKDHIGLSEMSEKMAWLREQQEGPWALGLTEVTPLGYDRYMT